MKEAEVTHEEKQRTLIYAKYLYKGGVWDEKESKEQRSSGAEQSRLSEEKTY